MCFEGRALGKSLNPLFIGSWFSPVNDTEYTIDNLVLIPFLSGRGSLRVEKAELVGSGGS